MIRACSLCNKAATLIFSIPGMPFSLDMRSSTSGFSLLSDAGGACFFLMGRWIDSLTCTVAMQTRVCISCLPIQDTVSMQVCDTCVTMCDFSAPLQFLQVTPRSESSPKSS